MKCHSVLVRAGTLIGVAFFSACHSGLWVDSINGADVGKEH
jgi:hypothetical protein